jgi:hypothetical protein
MNRIPSLDGLISISLVVAGDWMELHDHDVAAERASEDLDD